MTAGTHLDWQRITATLLLLPHVLLTVLAFFNLMLTLNVMDLYGTRVPDAVLGTIFLAGGIITCLALWKPGRFTTLGWISRARMAATGWNLLNCLWLVWLWKRQDILSRLQLGEMALAFITLCALLIFAIEEKKKA